MAGKNEIPMVSVRLVENYKLYSKEELTSPKAVKDFLKDNFSNMDREYFLCVNLNTHGNPINVNVVSIGNISSAPVHPSEIMKTAILSNAAAIIVCHNHPSGSIKPSEDDLETTKSINVAAALMGVRLLDHIIIGAGNDEYYSMMENNQIEHLTNKAARDEIVKGLEEEPEMVHTNIGTMPIKDYREIVAIQNGFDNYEEMKKEINEMVKSENEARSEKVYISLHKAYCSINEDKFDNSKTFNTMKFPNGTILNGEDIGGYVINPKLMYESKFNQNEMVAQYDIGTNEGTVMIKNLKEATSKLVDVKELKEAIDMQKAAYREMKKQEEISEEPLIKIPTKEEMFKNPEYVDYLDSSGGFIASDVIYECEDFTIDHQEEYYGRDTHGWNANYNYSYEKDGIKYFDSKIIAEKCLTKEEAYFKIVGFCKEQNITKTREKDMGEEL